MSTYFQVSPNCISKSTVTNTGGLGEWRDFIITDCCVTVLGRVPSLCAFYVTIRENPIAVMNDYSMDCYRQGQEIFLISKASTPAVVPAQSPFEWIPEALYPESTTTGVLLTTIFLPTLRMIGALPPYPNFFHGVHTDYFTFTTQL
jgi:hypothetical protein